MEDKFLKFLIIGISTAMLDIFITKEISSLKKGHKKKLWTYYYRVGKSEWKHYRTNQVAPITELMIGKSLGELGRIDEAREAYNNVVIRITDERFQPSIQGLQGIKEDAIASLTRLRTT